MRRPAAALAPLLLLAACDPGPRVTLWGFLFDSPWPAEDSVPVEAAAMEAFRDQAPDEVYVGGPLGPSQPGAFAIGFFEPGDVIHLTFEPEDPALLPTVLPLVLPEAPIEVDDGVFHVWSREAAASALGGEEALPSSGSGALIGRLARARERVGETVSLTAEGGSFDPVYLDEEGAADPALAGTSASGLFAFPDLPPGPATLHTSEADRAVWVVEGAITSVRADGLE